MDIAVCVAPKRAFDPGLRAHVSGVWANQKYKIETPNCLVIFKRQIRKTLFAGWGTDVPSPTPTAVRSWEAAQLLFPRMLAVLTLGDLSQSFMIPLWGQGKSKSQLWFRDSSALLLLLTYVFWGL